MALENDPTTLGVSSPSGTDDLIVQGYAHVSQGSQAVGPQSQPESTTVSRPFVPLEDSHTLYAGYSAQRHGSGQPRHTAPDDCHIQLGENG